QVQVWLAEGSRDTAARVRFSRNDPRKSASGRITAVSAGGERCTLEIPPAGKGGKRTRHEITVLARTRLVFFNVGSGAARLTAGDHVRGWLEESSEDTAEELTVLRPENTADRKPQDKKENQDE